MEMAETAAEKEGLNGGVGGKEYLEEEEPKGKENGEVAVVNGGEVMMVKEIEEEGSEENTAF